MTSVAERSVDESSVGRHHARPAIRLAGLAGVGALVLLSGPSASPPLSPSPSALSPSALSPSASQPDPNALALDPQAPIQTLSQAPGAVSQGALLIVQSEDLAPGRYHHDGPLRLVGDLTQPFIEIEATDIWLDGSIAADHVHLTASEGPREWHRPQLFELADGRAYLDGFQQVTPRGAIRASGSLSGEDIILTGGRIDIDGSASGDIALRASQGETAEMRLVVGLGDRYAAHPADYQVPRDKRDRDLPLELFANQNIADEHFIEVARWPSQSVASSITVGGGAGPGVMLQTPYEAAMAPVSHGPVGRAINWLGDFVPGFDDLPVRALAKPRL
ncbi:MAG: hypothetical protein AAF556_11985 [Pseudomonadota bacterium]